MINNHLLPEFGETPLSKIGPSDLTIFFDRARGGKQRKYLLNLYALLRVMFEVAVENDRLERSPVRKKLHRPVGSIVHSITRDVKTTQELLGHSRLSTTADIYTHVERAVGEEASEALAIVPDQDLPLASERIQ